MDDCEAKLEIRKLESMTSEERFERFLTDFMDAVDKCARGKGPSRLNIQGEGERMVTIDVYDSPEQMKEFAEMIRKASRNMKMPKPPPRGDVH